MSASVEVPLSETLKQEFQDEDYRYAYDEEFSNSRMATQIKVIREQRGLKQTELAELAEMKQSRISALEDVNYSAWSISTLRRLARALGVRLFFGFESWGELLPKVDNFGRKELEKPEFDKDPAFKDTSSEDEDAKQKVALGQFTSDLTGIMFFVPGQPLFSMQAGTSLRVESTNRFPVKVIRADSTAVVQPKLSFMYEAPVLVRGASVSAESNTTGEKITRRKDVRGSAGKRRVA